MPKQMTYIDSQAGMAMPTALVAAFMVGGLVYASTAISTSQVRDARHSLAKVKVARLAEAGVERGIGFLRDAIRKTSVHDPLLGVRNLFSKGTGSFQRIVPFAGQPIMDGSSKVGEFTTSMTATNIGTDIVDVTITATGYWPTAPINMKRGHKAPVSRTLQTTVRLKVATSQVFDYAYFINNWGWLYANSIYCNGNARSNGQFDCGNYTPTITGQPRYDSISWASGNATLSGYRDDNEDGLTDGNDGGVFAAWDIVGSTKVKGNGGLTSNQHDFDTQVPMPNLTDLTRYEERAKTQGGSIKIAGTTVCDAVVGDNGGEAENLYLVGTATDPIELNGTIVVRGNVIIKGVVKGQGAIYAGGNIYIPDGIHYQNPPATKRPSSNTTTDTEAWITANKDKDFLGLFARENVVVGDYTNPTYKSYVGGWMTHTLNRSDEDAGEDGIPNTVAGKDGLSGTEDDDVLENDGKFSTETYTSADAALGLIPPGFSVGDPVPGTGEDIDGDGVFDPTTTFADLEMPVPLTPSYWAGNMPTSGIAAYSSIATTKANNLDAAIYTNHAFTWYNAAALTINGAMVCRNESIIYSTRADMNYDCRLLGGATGIAGDKLLMPSNLEQISVMSWHYIDEDPNRKLHAN